MLLLASRLAPCRSTVLGWVADTCSSSMRAVLPPIVLAWSPPTVLAWSAGICLRQQQQQQFTVLAWTVGTFLHIQARLQDTQQQDSRAALQIG